MPRKLEILLKGGHVIDPANDIDTICDVGILDGRIARVEENIPITDADRVVDVGNLVVTPGLLDIHVHAYHTRAHGPGMFVGNLNADAHFLKEGVTTCVDTGTSGAEEFEHFRKTVIETSKTRILGFVNIAAPGMGDPEQVVANLNPQKAAETAATHDDVCVGIKTAHYWTTEPFDDEHPPWASIDATVEAGELCKMPVMVDFWPRPPERSYPDLLLKHLRPGDIHTHVFARQFPIVDEQGEVYDYMREARKKGIHFDLGHGAASFWYRAAMPAITDRFPPDSISTDLHTRNLHGPVYDMPTTMSKFLMLGLSLEDVVEMSTTSPAKILKREGELGTLRIGSVADVTVLERREGRFVFEDSYDCTRIGDTLLVAAVTVRRGEIVPGGGGLRMRRLESGSALG